MNKLLLLTSLALGLVLTLLTAVHIEYLGCDPRFSGDTNGGCVGYTERGFPLGWVSSAGIIWGNLLIDLAVFSVIGAILILLVKVLRKN